MDARELIARRAAQEFKDGFVVNLGFGIPVQAAAYIPEGVEVILQAENGILRFETVTKLGEEDPYTSDAACQPTRVLPGGSTFDIATSFAFIRGGHVDATILGALEVDQEGNIANWALPIAPGKYSPGMGGAMDLLVGARKVICTLQHTDKKGRSKILKKCTLPLSAAKAVDLIITELAVMEVTPSGLYLREVAPGVTVDQVKAVTEADLVVEGPIPEMKL
ncbi:MAG: 3-oxoacid CoA-transferase subunit B [Firmicutes bacterium]|jgi:acetate CoA/acetoacetate CoA-transferase beta subunit|nr:3-oxoacid CoA-transferase subunit B [Bacillota bacterium]